MILAAVLLADTVAEGLAGSSGWFGAGLLGLVLGWLLLVHLPRQEVRNDAKDKSFLERLESKDAAHANIIKLVNEAHALVVKNLTENAKEQIDVVTQHCRDELDEITKSFIERSDTLMNYFKTREAK